MAEIICKICGKNFNHHINGAEKRLLGNHLKKEHNISSYEYVKKTEYNNEHPKCLCGCGNGVRYSKWKFNMYYEEHKNKLPMNDEVKLKIISTFSNNSKFRYLKLGLTKEILMEIWEKYKTPDWTKNKIIDFYKIDFRTVVKYWKMFDIRNEQGLKRFSDLHKYVWGNQNSKNGAYIELNHELLDQMIDYAWKKYRAKSYLTISDIKKVFCLNCSDYILRKRLIEIFGESCLQLFNNGLASKPEIEFKYILEHYFGSKNIICPFKIKRKFYDFLLFDKLLIEYDGDYWHSQEKNIQNDRVKNELANEYGYKLFRILDSESKDPNIILKIKNILHEFEKI